MRYLLACLFVGSLLGQPWSGIIDSTRAIDWSTAGAGTIPARATQCGSTIAAYSGTAATINTAISSCTAGQHVLLGSGTFTLSTGILFNGKSDVTLRGSGADSTIINFTGTDACGGIEALICVKDSAQPDVYNYGDQSTNWTAGYSQGATSVTLSAKTNLQVGSMLLLSQEWDSTETNEVYICHGTVCTYSGGGGPLGGGDKANLQQFQLVRVTSISGGACPCTIGITPGLYMPNWRSARNPIATWGNNLPISGVGIEDLSIDGTNVSGTAPLNNITFYHSTASWVARIRSIKPYSHHIKFLLGTHITVRDSYFFDGKSHAEESYGLDTFGAADLLAENNIFQYITVPIMNEGGSGHVFSYNYSINDFFVDGTWAQPSWYTHSENNNYILFEGNDGYGFVLDNYHGPAFFMTAFRNRAVGFETGNTAQTIPIIVQAYNRYNNVIGNVLGLSGYHTNYQNRYGSEAEDVTQCYHSIYALGWGGSCSDSGSTQANETLSVTTLMRWGNWDVVSSTNDNGTNDSTGTKFVSAEVPSGISPYANAVPGSQTLPASFYLSARPSAWWKSNNITPAWPPIGPDVANGALANTGGHADRIPARICFEDIMGGTFGDTVAKTFNASTCYSAASESGSPAKSGGGAKHGGGAKIGDE